MVRVHRRKALDDIAKTRVLDHMGRCRAALLEEQQRLDFSNPDRVSLEEVLAVLRKAGNHLSGVDGFYGLDSGPPLGSRPPGYVPPNWRDSGSR